MLLFAEAASTSLSARDAFIQIAYLIASVLFILGLKGMTAPDKARNGMGLAAAGNARGRDWHSA